MLFLLALFCAAAGRKPITWVHVHKCGGTGVCNWAAERERIVKPNKNCNFLSRDDKDMMLVDDPPFWSCEDRVAEFKLQGATFGSIEHQVDQRLLECRESLLVGTMLRLPEKFARSAIAWEHFDPAHVKRFVEGTQDRLEQRLPRPFHSLASDWRLFDNFFVRVFSGAYDRPRGAIDRTHLERAMRFLDGCDVVAILERLEDRDAVQFQGIFGWTARAKRAQVQRRRVAFPDGFDDAFRRGNALDVELYQYADALAANRSIDVSDRIDVSSGGGGGGVLRLEQQEGRGGVLVVPKETRRAIGGPVVACPHAPRIERLNYSDMDAVVVSIGVMCSSAIGLRRLLYFYQLRRVYYVTAQPELNCPKATAIDPRVVCIGEREILPVSFATLATACRQVTRGHWSKPLGWYVQQFIKLGAALWIDDLSENYLIWDADNVLVYPEPLVDDQRRVFLAENVVATNDVNGYDTTAARLLGFPVPPTPSRRNWVVGYQVARRAFVREMLEHVDATASSSRRANLTFPLSVCAVAEPSLGSALSQIRWFSEYETYSQWLRVKHPEAIAGTYVCGLVRNPSWYAAGVRNRGRCCITEYDICRTPFKNQPNLKSGYYIIIEEHKYRSSNRCADY